MQIKLTEHLESAEVQRRWPQTWLSFSHTRITSVHRNCWMKIPACAAAAAAIKCQYSRCVTINPCSELPHPPTHFLLRVIRGHTTTVSPRSSELLARGSEGEWGGVGGERRVFLRDALDDQSARSVQRMGIESTGSSSALLRLCVGSRVAEWRCLLLVSTNLRRSASCVTHTPRTGYMKHLDHSCITLCEWETNLNTFMVYLQAMW